MQANDYLVSIIVPIYNDEHFLMDTIGSILCQTYNNFELIVIDDHSEDKSLETIKGINDPRIRIITNSDNRGAAYSRNVGIKAASGDYIAFLDGDDLWKKDKIEEQLSFMIDNGYDFSCTSYELINEKGKSLNKVISAPQIITHRDFMRSNFVGCLTVMYKKTIYEDLEIPENIYKRNDYALWLKLSEKCDCYYLNKNLAYYRKRTSSSISSGSKIKILKSHFVLFRTLYNFSKFKSFLLATRNVFYYFIRIIKYSHKAIN